MRERMIDGLKTLSSKKSAEISKLQEDLGHLQHNLRERDDKIIYLSEEVEAERRERNDAFEQARADRLDVETLHEQLKEELIALDKLRQESTQVALEVERQRESSLAKVQALQGHLAHLASEAHRFEIVEDYRHSTLGKVEVALACKAVYDYLDVRLSVEIRSDPYHFHYPLRVVNCLGELQKIERQGGGLMLDGGSGDEEGEESAEEAGEGSAHDNWVSRPEEKKDEEVESEV